jgi:rubrerythrin
MKAILRNVILSFIPIAALLNSTSAGTTLQNLATAYQGECNAANRYENFARQADAADFKEIARLFRGAAASEAIHRDLDKRAILKLGGQPGTFKLDAITPASTADNLKASIKGESLEVDTLYPGFLAAAKADNSKPAIRAFDYSLSAEKHHVDFFRQALDQLEAKTPITCYVCRDCGLLLTRLPDKKCPLCREGLKSFKQIK